MEILYAIIDAGRLVKGAALFSLWKRLSAPLLSLTEHTNKQ